MSLPTKPLSGHSDLVDVIRYLLKLPFKMILKAYIVLTPILTHRSALLDFLCCSYNPSLNICQSNETTRLGTGTKVHWLVFGSQVTETVHSGEETGRPKKICPLIIWNPWSVEWIDHEKQCPFIDTSLPFSSNIGIITGMYLFMQYVCTAWDD
jgi:hypothetical protein